MKKRFLLPLLLFFLPATIISAAYAGFVYSNKVDTKTDSNSGKIDDVKPNFKLDENNYTIYFFPSMQAAYMNFNNDFSEANIATKIDGANPRPDDYKPWFGDEQLAWGYWGDVNGSEIIGNADATKKKYCPKKIETHGGPSISLKQFNSIGEPSTNGRDNKKYPLYFSGWTTIKETAKDKYRGQGEYNYISAFDDLTKIDNDISDGTKAGDKVIFVYPIFTSGKDYEDSNNKSSVVQLAASMPNPDKPDETITKPRYLSRIEGDEKATYFYYKNLVIDENDPWTWSLSFSGYRSYIWGSGPVWYTNWGNYRKNYIYKDNSNSIITQPGVYNIYAYLAEKKPVLEDFETLDFNKDINSYKMPLVHEDDPNKPDEVNTVVERVLQNGEGRGEVNYWLFVKIEKVYEFRLAGTEGRGFTFDTAGQLYVSHFSSANFNTLKDSNGVSASTKYPSLDNSLWKMYYLDNVFMEKGKNNIFAEYKSFK